MARIQNPPAIIGGDKAHAVFSASGSHRWLVCHGSILLSEKAPPQVESSYAKTGTDAHTCLETILKNLGKRLSIEAQLRKEYPSDMVDRVSQAADEIVKRWKASPGSKLMCEQKVDAGPFTRPGEFGTLDAAIVDVFGTLEVIDYKDGFMIVDVEDNSQMIYYALALAHKFLFNFERVRLTVIQPNASHDSGTIRSHDMMIGELSSWIVKFKTAVVKALKPNAVLVAGSHCKYCPAITICPEVSTRALEECRIEFSPVLDSLDVPEVKGLDADTIASILKHAEAIEHWISEVRALAFTKLDHGIDVPGWKLVPKRPNRKWINAEKTAAEAKKAFGDIAFDHSLKSPAQLEILAADAKPWVAKRAQAVSSGLTLAPEHDKREGATNAELQFKPVKGEIEMAKKKTTAKKATTKKKTAKKSK